MRLLLLLGANMAILAMLSLTFQVLGIERLLLENGVRLNLGALLIYAAFIGFAGCLISLLLSKSMAIRSMGVHLIDAPHGETERWLVDTVAAQAKAAGIGMPQVGIFEGAPNAFATGWRKDAALVAVSTGLLQHMTHEEVEAVLGHEISHVANGDMVTLTLVQGVVNTFVVFLSRIIGHVVDRAVFKNQRGHGPAFFITSMIAQFVLGILATLIVRAFSRWREYRADAGGAALSERRHMIAALRRLQSLQSPPALPDEMAAFGISGGSVAALFASHPPLAKRIQALESA